MNIGESIKAMLDAREKKVPWLSEQTGIPASTLYTMLNNNKIYDFEKLQKISDALGMRIDEMLGVLIQDGAIEVEWPEDLERQANDARFRSIDNIQINIDKLNDTGVEKIASYSEDLVNSGKYQR